MSEMFLYPNTANLLLPIFFFFAVWADFIFYDFIFKVPVLNFSRGNVCILMLLLNTFLLYFSNF